MKSDDHRDCVEVEVFFAIFCFWLWLWLVLSAHSAHNSCHRPSASHRRWHDLSRNFFFYSDSTRDLIRNLTHHPSYLFFHSWTSIWIRLAQKAKYTSEQLIFLRRLSTRFKERERIMSVSEGDCTKSHSLIPYESLSKLQKLLHNIRKSLNSKHSKLANQCLIARECEHPWIHAWILAGYTGCRTILALILNFGIKFSFP
jgi:hypothetical protein